MSLHTRASAGTGQASPYFEDKENNPQATKHADSCSNPNKDGSTDDHDPEKGTLDEKARHELPNQCTCGYHPKDNLVDFQGKDDPDNPKNWPKWRRWAITTSMGLMTFVVTFSSSIFSVAVAPVAEEFHVSNIVATLGVSLFLFVSHDHHFNWASPKFRHCPKNMLKSCLNCRRRLSRRSERGRIWHRSERDPLGH